MIFLFSAQQVLEKSCFLTNGYNDTCFDDKRDANVGICWCHTDLCNSASRWTSSATSLSWLFQIIALMCFPLFAWPRMWNDVKVCCVGRKDKKDPITQHAVAYKIYEYGLNIEYCSISYICVLVHKSVLSCTNNRRLWMTYTFNFEIVILFNRFTASKYNHKAIISLLSSKSCIISI